MAIATDIAEIQKRDGRIVAFDRSKIVGAIMRAAQAAQGTDYQLADVLSLDVVRRVLASGSVRVPLVETIQDTIEKVLIEHGHARTAKAFILYRARRSRIREGKSELMETVAELLEAGDLEGGARRAAVGFAASREFYLNRLLSEATADAHLAGELHLHGLADYDQVPNGFALPLGRLLRDGFSVGHGAIRRAKRPGSASAQIAVLLQAAQAEAHGGVAFAAFDTDLASLFEGELDPQELAQAMESLVYSLNAIAARGGDRLPYANLHLGLDTTPRGRAITLALLDALHHGLGRGEAALRPHVVFRLKAGVNLHEGDPNFDLTRRAAALACVRPLVTFMYDDAEAVWLGHEGLVGSGGALQAQISRTSINLPRLALLARREGKELGELLDAALRRAALISSDRLDALGDRALADFPCLAGGASGDDARATLTGGTLALGLVGLAQALMVQTGRHHGASEESQAAGLVLVSRAAETCHALSRELGLRVVLQAVEAGGPRERFARLDRRDFGLLKDVTERPSYSAGVAVPAEAGLGWRERATIEGAYAPYFDGGCLHRDLAAGLTADEAVERLQAVTEAGVRAYALDFPLSHCAGCGHAAVGALEERCGSCKAPGARPLVRQRGYLELA